MTEATDPQLADQHYSYDRTSDARDIIKLCREYVYKATIERDFSAYPLLARIDEFLK